MGQGGGKGEGTAISVGEERGIKSDETHLLLSVLVSVGWRGWWEKGVGMIDFH